jgi:hypothetical protein
MESVQTILSKMYEIFDFHAFGSAYTNGSISMWKDIVWMSTPD